MQIETLRFNRSITTESTIYDSVLNSKDENKENEEVAKREAFGFWHNHPFSVPNLKIRIDFENQLHVYFKKIYVISMNFDTKQLASVIQNKV